MKVSLTTKISQTICCRSMLHPKDFWLFSLKGYFNWLCTLFTFDKMRFWKSKQVQVNNLDGAACSDATTAVTSHCTAAAVRRSSGVRQRRKLSLRSMNPCMTIANAIWSSAVCRNWQCDVILSESQLLPVRLSFCSRNTNPVLFVVTICFLVIRFKVFI